MALVCFILLHCGYTNQNTLWDTNSWKAQTLLWPDSAALLLVNPRVIIAFLVLDGVLQAIDASMGE